MRLIARCFFFCFVVCFAATAYAAKPYDDFSAERMDPTKWVGRGGEPLEMSREATRGILEIWSIGGFENKWEDSLLNNMPVADPNSIDSLSVDVTLLDASHSGTVWSAEAGIEGTFYEEFGGGDVSANINIASTPGGYVVFYGVSAPGGTTDDTPFTLIPKKGQKYNIKIAQSNNKIIFSVHGYTENFAEVRTVTGVNPRSGLPINEYKALYTGIMGQKQTTGEGMIDAEFDNVWKNNALYDDFSSNLDKRKWQGYEMARVVDNNQAAIQLGNLGNNYKTQIDFNPTLDRDNRTNYTKADITVYDNSIMGDGTHGQFRLWRTPGNYKYSTKPNNIEQDGEVTAYNKIFKKNDGSLYAEASVAHCADEICDVPGFVVLFQEKFSCIIEHNVPVTLSLEQAGNTLIFTCGAEVKTYTYPTTLYTSFWKIQSFRSRVYSKRGNSGWFNLSVDNVYLNKSFPWTSFLPAIMEGRNKK